MKRQSGFSLIELLIVVAVILIIAAIAIPSLLRSKIAANEAAAVSMIRNVHNAELVYLNTYGANVGYANTLFKLGNTQPCDKNHACMVDELTACAAEPCMRGAYFYSMMSDQGSEPFLDYSLTASPVSWGSSGTRNFCTTEDGFLRQERTPSGPIVALPHDTCVNPGSYVALQN